MTDNIMYIRFLLSETNATMEVAEDLAVVAYLVHNFVLLVVLSFCVLYAYLFGGCLAAISITPTGDFMIYESHEDREERLNMIRLFVQDYDISALSEIKSFVRISGQRYPFLVDRPEVDYRRLLASFTRSDRVKFKNRAFAYMSVQAMEKLQNFCAHSFMLACLLASHSFNYQRKCFMMKDFDYFDNHMCVRNFLRTGNVSHLFNQHGFTTIDGHTFPYVFYTGEVPFRNFLRTLASDEIRALKKKNIEKITPELVIKLLDFVNYHAFVDQAFRGAHVIASIDLPLVGRLNTRDSFYFVTIVSPVCEEVFKFIGTFVVGLFSHFLFGLIEFSFRRNLKGLVPFFLHCSLAFFPFPIRVVIHMLYNYIVINHVYFYASLPSVLSHKATTAAAKIVGEIAFDVQFVYALANCDWINVGFMIAQMPSKFADFDVYCQRLDLPTPWRDSNPNKDDPEEIKEKRLTRIDQSLYAFLNSREANNLSEDEIGFVVDRSQRMKDIVRGAPVALNEHVRVDQLDNMSLHTDEVSSDDENIAKFRSKSINSMEFIGPMMIMCGPQHEFIERVQTSFSRSLPGFVHASDQYKKLASLVMLVVGSKFVISENFWKSIQLDWYHDLASITDAILLLFQSVYKGVMRVMETGNIGSFFVAPKELEFEYQAVEVLNRRYNVEDYDETKKLLDDISDVMALRENIGVKATPLVCRYFNDLAALYAKISSELEYIDKDLQFYRIASKVIANGIGVSTFEELDNKVMAIESLIETRVSKKNSPMIYNTIRDLTQFANKVIDAKKSFAYRAEPILVILIGEPGTGKTSVLHSIENVIFDVCNFKRGAGDVVPIDLDKKHPAGGGDKCMNKEAGIMIINDCREDWTSFEKSDKLPLDSFLQQVCDKFPMSLPAASIEDKAKVFSNLVGVIITTNNPNMKFYKKSDKLTRRLASAIVVEQRIMKDGLDLSYSQFSQMSEGVRNDHTHFTIMRGVAKDMHLEFKRTEITYQQRSFYVEMRRLMEEHHHRAKLELEKFTAPDQTCPCGMVNILHSSEVRSGDIVSNNVEDAVVKTKTFEEMFEKCRENHPKGYSHRRLLRVNLKEEKVVMVGPEMIVPAISFYFAPNLSFFVFGAYLMMLVITCWEAIKCEIIDVLLKLGILDTLKQKGVIEMKYYVAKARLSKYKLYRFLTRSDVQIFLGLSSAAVLAMFVGAKKNLKVVEVKQVENRLNPEMAGKIVNREDVDPKSMEVLPPTKVTSWDLANVRSWTNPLAQHYEANLVKTSVNITDLVKMCNDSRIRVDVHFDDEIKYCQPLIFVVDNAYFIINRHIFAREDASWRFKEFVKIDFNGATTFVRIGDIFPVGGTEFLVVRHNFPFLSIRPRYNFFQKNAVPKQFKARLVKENEVVEIPIVVPILHEVYGQRCMAYEFPYGGLKKGDCMTPLLGHFDGGWCITGFVSYIYEGLSRSGVCMISFEHYRSAVERDTMPTYDSVVMPDLPETFQKPTVNTCMLGYAAPNLQLLGRLEGGTKKFKSSIVESQVYDYFSTKLSKPYAAPWAVRGVTKEGDYKSAFLKSTANFAKTSDLSYAEFEMPIVEYVAPLLRDIGNRRLKTTPLSLEDAIFGNEDLRIKRMAFNTSCGPICKKQGIRDKSDLFEYEGEKFVFNEEFRQRIFSFLAVLRANDIVAVYEEWAEKDEVRPREKLEQFNVRLFAVLDAVVNFVARMYLMPIIVYMLSVPELSECYGGMNAGSWDWNEFHKRIFKKGRKYGDADFGSFDFSHCAPVLRAVSRVVELIAEAIGYDEESVKIAKLLVLVLIWQVVVYQNDIFLKFCGLPSGYILTLLLNSIANSLLMRVVYQRIFNSVGDFRSNVDVGTVGDDNLFNVVEEISDRFNMVVMKPIYEKMGYNITNANKSTTVQPFVSEKDAVFVKRHFKYHDDLKCIVGPLELDSIYKALCFDKKDSKSISPIDRLSEVSMGCQREAFLHGRAFFEEFQSQLEEANQRCFGGLWAYKKLNYSELVEEFGEGKFTTFAM